ncbi:hypothetical protein HYT04_03080 [Candidatus Kaiserbacteria bacterium]|nr:hypothetical protein [Candidatus Kaiserbacteria bacterium]
MIYLIFILASLALLVGFFALTRYEARRGVRFYSAHRDRLDRAVERIVFISEHVNFAEFLRDEVRYFAGRVGHGVAHFSLIGVRSIERLLTDLVRRLRNHPEIDTAPRETAREFVKTLSDFKGSLNATHPEISDIH